MTKIATVGRRRRGCDRRHTDLRGRVAGYDLVHELPGAGDYEERVVDPDAEPIIDTRSGVFVLTW